MSLDRMVRVLEEHRERSWMRSTHYGCGCGMDFGLTAGQVEEMRKAWTHHVAVLLELEVAAILGPCPEVGCVLWEGHVVGRPHEYEEDEDG